VRTASSFCHRRSAIEAAVLGEHRTARKPLGATSLLARARHRVAKQLTRRLRVPSQTLSLLFFPPSRPRGPPSSQVVSAVKNVCLVSILILYNY